MEQTSSQETRIRSKYLVGSNISLQHYSTKEHKIVWLDNIFSKVKMTVSL